LGEVPNGVDDNFVPADLKYRPMCYAPAEAIEQLPDCEWKGIIFWCQAAAFWIRRQRGKGDFETVKPSRGFGLRAVL
jgi:hypothetical protein